MSEGPSHDEDVPVIVGIDVPDGGPSTKMKKRKRAMLVGAAALACVVVAVAVVAVVTAQKRPADCAPSQAERAKAQQATRYAMTSVRGAVDVVTQALERADQQDRRWFVLRRYDVALCKRAADALAAADVAVALAKAQKGHVDEVSAAGQKSVAQAKEQMARAIGWLEAGIVNDDLVKKLRAGRAAVDDAGRAVERSYGALEAAGYEGDVAALERAAAQAATEATAAQQLARAAKVEGTTRCAPKSKGVVYDVESVKTFETWVVMRGPSASFVFAFDKDSKRCALLHAQVKKNAATILPGADAREELFTWRVPALVETKLLVGWSPHHAWFLAHDGDWRAYPHATKCSAVGDGCPKPKFVEKALESHCTCSTSEHPVDARYLWDGHAVIVEN